MVLSHIYKVWTIRLDASPRSSHGWPYQALRQQGEQDRAIGELLVGLQKMLSYAKACCELKGIEGVPNVIEEVEGALLIDQCMKSGFIGELQSEVRPNVLLKNDLGYRSRCQVDLQ
jgi:hypothetical protein